MKNQYLKNRGYLPLLLSFTLTSPQLLAAEKINLRHYPGKMTLLASTLRSTNNKLKIVNQDLDFNGMRHLRIKQYYRGYPVWGADGVLHLANGQSLPLFKNGHILQSIALQNTTSMNGVVYEQLEDDLSQSPPTFNVEQVRQEIDRLNSKKNELTASSTKDFKAETIVYIDKNNKAHWAYLTSVYLSLQNGLPQIPTYILDAETLSPYMHWDNLKTNDKLVQAGGLGGNEKKYFGDVIYDYSHDQAGHNTLRREPSTIQ